MTQKELFRAVRAWGLTISVRDGEYRITVPQSREFTQASYEAAAYYTCDRQDAWCTARVMSLEYGTRTTCR